MLLVDLLELERISNLVLWYREFVRSRIQKKNDQERTMTPVRALELGADLLVIGRPITKLDDPLQALQDMF